MRSYFADLAVLAVDHKLALFLLSELAATTDSLVPRVKGLQLVARHFKRPGVSLRNYVKLDHYVRRSMGRPRAERLPITAR